MFETAVGDMRKMLDHEVEAKQEAFDALTQLSAIQKKYKVTWVPKDSVKVIFLKSCFLSQSCWCHP